MRHVHATPIRRMEAATIRLVVLSVLAVGPASAQTTISFPAGDTVRLEADVYGSGDRGIVVIGHGGYSTRASWKSEAVLLANGGFRTLVFDTRGAVAFARGRETACLYDAVCIARDVLAAVRYLRGAGAKTIAIIGGSAGGGGAAQASIDASPGEIDWLVLLAPMSVEAPERMKGRKLFATAGGDLGSDDKPRLPEIRAQFERAPAPKEFLLLEGSAHGQRIFGSSEGARLRREIVRFLATP